jgi:hypothetical protein
VLNLFYLEPDSDRWLSFDRYPRRIIRRLLRGKPRPSGHGRTFLNLCAGLNRIRVPYRVNDFRFARKHSKVLVCIVGKSFLLDKIEWENPILFGPCGYSHPMDDPQLLERLPVKRVLVYGPWEKEMYEPYWGETVKLWPVGIDTDMWQPCRNEAKTVDVLIYDKVRWEHDNYETDLIRPIRSFLRKSGRSYLEIRYGHYREEGFRLALARCRVMIFLCEHETQGIAYQQALSGGVPIFAWDRGGPWQDPSYYPHKVIFSPVTSIPYWDERCGYRFSSLAEFEAQWSLFWDDAQGGRFVPRDYVLENLTLEKCAREYVKIAGSVEGAS